MWSRPTGIANTCAYRPNAGFQRSARPTKNTRDRIFIILSYISARTPAVRLVSLSPAFYFTPKYYDNKFSHYVPPKCLTRRVCFDVSCPCRHDNNNNVVAKSKRHLSVCVCVSHDIGSCPAAAAARSRRRDRSDAGATRYTPGSIPSSEYYRFIIRRPARIILLFMIPVCLNCVQVPFFFFFSTPTVWVQFLFVLLL